MYKYLIPFVLLLFLQSCQEDDLYHLSHPFGENGWTYADSLRFDFEIQDTSKRYDIFLTVHHTPDYDFENLYVKFSTIFPKGQKALDGKKRVDQITSLKLAEIDGSWLGKCSAKACTYQIPIQIKAWFPDAGPYSLLVEQYMRTDSLKSIKGIDFALRLNRLK